MDFKTCTTSTELNKKLHTIAFGTTQLVDKYNLADQWAIDTQDGNEYVQNHGLHIVQQALDAHCKEDDLQNCLLVHPSMINYNNSILPPGTGLQHGLLHACAKNMTHSLLYKALANKVINQTCVNLVHFEPKPESTDKPTVSSSAVTLANADDTTEKLTSQEDGNSTTLKTNKRRRKA